MKFILASLSVIMFSACTSKTEFGACIGIADEKKQDLEYKLSIKNTAIAIIFSELIFPPILVLSNETFCPIGKK